MSDLDRALSVAVFSDSAFPVLNGVSVSIDLLVKGLRAKGHSVHLFSTGVPGHKDKDPNTHRSHSLRTPFSKDYPLAIPPFYRMLYDFRRQDFDLIHTHTPFTVGFVGLRWAESHELPIVATYHTNYDKYIHYVPVAPKRFLRYKLAKHLNYYYNRVDQVITPGEASKRWLMRHSVKTPITIVPTGVQAPPMMDRSRAREILRIPLADRVLLYAGRLAPEKNIDLLLRAVAAVMGEVRDVRLVLVGDGPARVALSRLARDLKVGDRVSFVGAVSREAVDNYYAAADLFVFASMTETQGLVVTEAMSHGLPVVVVQGGGACEHVIEGSNGFVSRNDVGEFSSLVVKCLSDEALSAILKDGAHTTARQFSVEATTDRVLDVYRQAMEVADSTVRSFARA